MDTKLIDMLELNLESLVDCTEDLFNSGAAYDWEMQRFDNVVYAMREILRQLRNEGSCNS